MRFWRDLIDSCGGPWAADFTQPTTRTEDGMDNEEVLGPIDAVVIGYPPGSPMKGDAVPIFMDLVDRGVIRVFDALFVRKNEDGTVSGADFSDLDEDTAGDLMVFNGASTGLLGNDDVEKVAAELEPGAGAAVIVYENRWAAPFVAAVRRNGGVLIASERIGAQDLLDALEASEATAN